MATPASAHTGTFTRDCGSVTVHLTKFHASARHTNKVHILRNGTEIDVIEFHESSAMKTYTDQPSTGTLTFEAKWMSSETTDGLHGDVVEQLAAPDGCTPPCQEKGAFTYTFDGASGKAVVTLHGETPLCAPVTVLLASFKTEGPTWETSGHQTVFDQMSAQISKPGDYPLTVKVPTCFTQVDLYVTDKKAMDFDFPNDTLGAFLASTVWPGAGPRSAFNGGTVGCLASTPTPAPTTVAPTSAVAPPPPAGGTPGTALPNTGASPMPKITIAVVLLGVGTALVLIGRRRRTAH